ncbi:MASE1 domain-containing protein [Ramlibacter sp. USB13]|uniref:histidine kinase n=1 Tax=Ramlibacter cellulosilyticus TaxID=2764187 RepID=A0A923SG69_9BURK|nr:ATP-binding protein [Ramlibacter cellulosilyticus]MBC5784632.1 MASE1 domain-containing protein [Ramlibacter cellulosilyticus]
MASLSTRVPRMLAAAWARPQARLAAYLALSLALAWVSFIHPARGLNITPWNPQTALAVGMLLWHPRSWWLVWLATLSGEALVPERPLGGAALFGSTALLVAGYVATAAALRRWARPGSEPVTRRLLLRFFVIAGGGALLASTLQVAGLYWTGEVAADRVLTAIHRSAIGDGAALVVTLPLLLLLGSRERRAATRAMFRNPEWWAAVLVTAVAVIAVFSRPAEEQFRYFYVLFLPVVWCASRHGITGAVWSTAVLQLAVIAAVQAAEYQPLTVFQLQVLVAVLAVTSLLLGATVDEREEAARTLRASLRLAAAGDMAAGLAHELNQPLTAMSTYAHASQVLAEQIRQGDRSQAELMLDITAKLAEEAHRAADVVRRLRDFFRDRATDLKPTSLAQLLEEAHRDQIARAVGLDLQLSWHCEPADAVAWVDPLQVGVVLRNLLANAMDAASAAGRGGNLPAWVAVEAKQEDADMVIAVTDSGPGLHGEDLALVFERRRSDKPGGMGIGLAISRSIVEAHGGRLWAEPGPGGRFLFTLPLESPVADA